jgi:hypothetical protein
MPGDAPRGELVVADQGKDPTAIGLAQSLQYCIDVHALL